MAVALLGFSLYAFHVARERMRWRRRHEHPYL